MNSNFGKEKTGGDENILEFTLQLSLSMEIASSYKMGLVIHRKESIF